MSNFYVIILGEIKKRMWCDNSDCPNYSTRNGLSNLDAVLTVGKMHFCSSSCHNQAAMKGEAPTASDVAKAEQLLKDGKSVTEIYRLLLAMGVKMSAAAIIAARLKYIPDTGWPL